MRCSARVIRIHENGLAEVELDRSDACGQACSLCGDSARTGEGSVSAVMAVNSAEAREGDVVTVECEKSRGLSMLLIFIVPFACYFAAYFLSGLFPISETSKNLFAGAGFLLSAIPYLRNRRLRRPAPFTITEITGT